MLIQAEHDQKSINDSIVNMTYGRNELYQTRVEVKYENADGDVEAAGRGLSRMAG